jgi:hypothetical protein
VNVTAPCGLRISRREAASSFTPTLPGHEPTGREQRGDTAMANSNRKKYSMQSIRVKLHFGCSQFSDSLIAGDGHGKEVHEGSCKDGEEEAAEIR